MKKMILTALSSLLLISCSEATDGQLSPEISNETKSSSSTAISSVNNEVTFGKDSLEIDVNGTKREYILHVPKSYSTSNPIPLLFSIHGLSSNMEFNYGYTKFNELAETEGFILVHPNGIDNRWSNSAADNPDIDFIQLLLIHLKENYNIDSNRIYTTGMSLGGFFSFSLACQLSGDFAAVASVTGTMYRPTTSSCTPSKPMPILQIHGTDDNIVDYSTVTNVLDYWTDFNNTDLTPVITDLPDIDVGDGSTVEKHVYSNGDNGVEVIHYKVIGGKHQWPGYQGNMDIDASNVVWEFLKGY